MIRFLPYEEIALGVIRVQSLNDVNSPFMEKGLQKSLVSPKLIFSIFLELISHSRLPHHPASLKTSATPLLLRDPD